MSENENAIQVALAKDLGKPGFEAVFAEVISVENEIRSMLDQLDDWLAPEAQPTPLALLPGSSFVQRDPYGVVLIVAPFNYPVQLTMLPLVAAISAGNCAIIKPSELTPASSALLQKLIPRYLDPRAFKVVTGAVEETTALLKEKFDYIFFTGSENVGKIVAKAAAETLTPVTLELGGQCIFCVIVSPLPSCFAFIRCVIEISLLTFFLSRFFLSFPLSPFLAVFASQANLLSFLVKMRI